MCPKGRLAEDGKISEKYLLTETSSAEYAQRTIENVKLSDGTLILFNTKMDKGTRLTLKIARKLNRPVFSIDYNKSINPSFAKNWIENYNIKILNIAGPRESTNPGIYTVAFRLLKRVFEQIK